MNRLTVAGLAFGAAVFGSGCVHARYEGPIIDTHAHIFPEADKASLSPNMPADGPTLLAQMDRAHIQRAGIITIAHRGQLAETREENDRLLELVHQHPDRFFAICSVHPDDGDDALKELDRVAKAGAKGLKLHPNSQAFDVASPNVAAVVTRAGQQGLVVLFDGWNPFDADQTGKFVKLAIAVPKTNIIIAHMAGARFPDLLVFKVLSLYPNPLKNVWFDISGISHLLAGSPFVDQLRWEARQMGTDRILFGSDFPLFVPSEAVADVDALGFTAAEQRQIFHDNAVALFGLQ